MILALLASLGGPGYTLVQFRECREVLYKIVSNNATITARREFKAGARRLFVIAGERGYHEFSGTNDGPFEVWYSGYSKSPSFMRHGQELYVEFYNHEMKFLHQHPETAVPQGNLPIGGSKAWGRPDASADPRFQFSFCAIAQGTNYTFFSGNKLLARLNGGLTAGGLSPLTEDRVYQIRSASNATLLGVGYTFSDDGPNPPATGTTTNLLTVVLVKPDGSETRIVKSVANTIARRPGEHVALWIIPPGETNLSGCKLRFSDKKGKHIATVDL